MTKETRAIRFRLTGAKLFRAGERDEVGEAALAYQNSKSSAELTDLE